MVKSMTTVDDKSVDYSVAGEQCILVLGGTDQSKVSSTVLFTVDLVFEDKFEGGALTVIWLY